MIDDICAACDAAIGAVSDAVFIVERFSEDSAWLTRPDELTIPALEFDRFVTEVREAFRLVNHVVPRLIEAKRDDQLIEFGNVCERTAHHVAVRFAQRVENAIVSNLTANGLRTRDGLLNHIGDFRARWQNIRDALRVIQIGRLDDIIARITLEAERAAALTIDSAPEGTVAVESAIPTPAATDGTDQPPGYLGLTIDANRRTVSRSGYPAVVDDITQKEWSLFVAMLRAAERGLTKEESERAYDGEKDSIRDTKSRLRGKLLPLDVTVAKGKSKLIASVRGSSEISDEA